MSITRTSTALVLIFFAAACNDLSVDVSLRIADQYRDDVHSIKLEILVPPVAGPFDCDDVAFQEVSPDTVALSRIQEHTLEQRERVGLSGIPRLGTKLFLAHGFDDQGLSVVAACGALDEIDGNETVELVAEPSIVVIAPEAQLGAELPPELPVFVTGAQSQSIGDVEVRWRVTGPGGAPNDGVAISDGRGEATLEPEAPALPGPTVLDIRARWARDPPPRLATFQPTTRSIAIDVPGSDASSDPIGTRTRVTVGRVGPDGEMGIAATGPDSGGLGRPVYIAYYDPALSPPFQVNVSAPILGVVTLGLTWDGQRDRVVTLIAGRWIEVHPNGTVDTTFLPDTAGTAKTIVSVGTCEPGAVDDILLISFLDEAQPVAAFTADGATVASPFVAAAPNNRLLAGGCVGDVGGQSRRVAVFNEAGTRSHVLADIDQVRSTEWLTFPGGVGFAPPIGVEPAALLGVRIAIDGTSVARYRLLALGGFVLDLDVVAEDESTTPSVSSAGGDVDGDERLDVVAALDFGRGDDGPQYRVFAALGAQADGQRLTAVSPLQSGEDPEVFVADFDEDGVDDLIMVTTEKLTLWLMGEP